MTLSPSPINMLDAAAATKPIVSYNDGTNNVTAHVLLDSTGAITSPATSGNQATANTSLATIATNTGHIPVTGSTTSALSRRLMRKRMRRSISRRRFLP